MIEIAIGLLLAAGTLAVVVTGLLPLLGYGVMIFPLAIAALLVAAGLTRRAIRAASTPARRHALRSARLAVLGLLATAALAIGVPFAAEPLHLVRWDGVPLGYYLGAQGALILLVILSFVWVARQNRIDAEDAGHEDAGHE